MPIFTLALAMPMVRMNSVCAENLDSDVSVMESAEDWYRCDWAELLRAAKMRRILVQ